MVLAGPPPSPSRRASTRARAMPKSVTTTRPSLPRSTLSGLRSRCTTPAACAPASPSAMATPTATARPTEKAPSRASAAESDSPSTYSMVRNFSPSCSPMSNTRATFWWVTRRASLASRRKRSRIPGVESSSRRITLSATISSSSRSRARYTVPMPPAPTSARISYRPASRGRSPECALALEMTVAGAPTAEPTGASSARAAGRSPGGSIATMVGPSWSTGGSRRGSPTAHRRGHRRPKHCGTG